MFIAPLGRSRGRRVMVATLAALVMMMPAANADPIPPDPPDPFNEGPALDIGEMPPGHENETPAEVLPLGDSGLGADEDFGSDATPGVDAVPAPPNALPATADAAPGWQPTYSCDPNDKPGMLAFAELVSQHYDRPNYYTSRSCIQGGTSQHYDGRAFDWSMNAYNAQDKAIGDEVARWLTANDGAVARRFGIQSVIWNRESWYLYSPSSWRVYTGSSPHTDHLHISFTWDGAMKNTSWWTDEPVQQIDNGTCRVYAGEYAPRYTRNRLAACPSSMPSAPSTGKGVFLPGASNADVRHAQQEMGFTGGDVDGKFGPQTLAGLLTHQENDGVPVTGVLDSATWHRMLDLHERAPNSAIPRIQGSNRYGTAAQISADVSPGTAVWITTGQDFPDALTASAAAGSQGAPLLLTSADSLPPATQSALSRIQPRSITIVGGDAVVSPAVEAALGDYTAGSVRRINGVNRYETAAMVSQTYSSSVPLVYLADGENFPDALAGAARAGLSSAPVLLTRTDSLPSQTKSALDALAPTKIVVLGGEAAVSQQVENQAAAYATSGVIERIGAASRWGTAADLGLFYPPSPDAVYVANGNSFPDALAAAAAAGDQGAPVLLVKQGSVPAETREALAALHPRKIVVVGGGAAISTATREELREFVRTNG